MRPRNIEWAVLVGVGVILAYALGWLAGLV